MATLLNIFIFQNINEDEFREIISSLMQVTWSAAAGQLQLNTKHTLTAPTTSTSNAKQQQHVHFSHDQLKAGLCIRQETVSIMVSSIGLNN